MMEFFTLASAVLAAYLLGSVSSAILICKLFRLPDPRQGGSKNPGTTNVLRLGGKLPALLTLVGDAAKGFVPVLISLRLEALNPWVGFIALAAFLGHLFPIFFGFRGGKGVATLIGASWALNWQLGLAFCLSWLMVALMTRYSSLAALCASLLLPFVAWHLNFEAMIIPLAMMASLLWVRHHTNIRKLLEGNERKIGRK